MMQNWGRPALKFSGFVLDPRPQPQFPSYHRALHCSRREPGVVSSHCLTADSLGFEWKALWPCI